MGESKKKINKKMEKNYVIIILLISNGERAE